MSDDWPSRQFRHPGSNRSWTSSARSTERAPTSYTDEVLTDMTSFSGTPSDDPPRSHLSARGGDVVGDQGSNHPHVGQQSWQSPPFYSGPSNWTLSTSGYQSTLVLTQPASEETARAEVDLTTSMSVELSSTPSSNFVSSDDPQGASQLFESTYQATAKKGDLAKQENKNEPHRARNRKRRDRKSGKEVQECIMRDSAPNRGPVHPSVAMVNDLLPPAPGHLASSPYPPRLDDRDLHDTTTPLRDQTFDESDYEVVSPVEEDSPIEEVSWVEDNGWVYFGV